MAAALEYRCLPCARLNRATYGNVHLLPKTSVTFLDMSSEHGSCIVSFSLHKDQDQINVHCHFFYRKGGRRTSQ